jgi:predicted dehydrogenase
MSDSSKMGRRDFLYSAVAGAASVAVSPRSGASTSKKLRYGVVGSGSRSRGAHLKILHEYVPEVEVVALCDITPENLRSGLEICGPSTAGYSDHRRMLTEHPELDAVIVVVPNYKHADIVIDALNAGMHVLTEKPIAIHLADADRMIAAAQARQRILQVGFQMRYLNIYRRMHDLIREGAIGDVEYVWGALFRGDWNPKSWKYTDPQTGQKTIWRYLTLTCGSALLEDGIHEFDIIHWLVGAEPVRIEAQGGNNVFRDRETIDHAGLLVEFSNGTKCTFGFTIFTPHLTDGRTMRFLGSKGEMFTEQNGNEEFIVIRPYQGQPERISVPYLLPKEAAFWKGGGAVGDFDVATYREHKAFIQSVTEGTPPFVNGKVGRDAVHISLAAERSLRTGHAVSWDDQSL